MDILSAIDKQIFELHVPVARMPERSGNVFDSLKDNIVCSYEQICNNIIGKDFVEKAEEDAELRVDVLRYVCIAAFVMSARQLDIVLTATGFGIVNTETLSPASAQRVNALIDSMRARLIVCREDVIRKMIRVDGWGESRCARECIPTLFWSVSHYFKAKSPLRAEDWAECQRKALTAQTILCDYVSRVYMEELLHKIRTMSTTEADDRIIDKCLVYMVEYISMSEECYDDESIRRLAVIIRELLESNIEDYPTYRTSREYERRHARRYQNRMEDPSYFFM